MGDQGIQGIQGMKGDKGDMGDQGIQGIQGVKGDQGDPGTPFQFPTKMGTLEFRFQTISAPGGNDGFWRGVVIQPDQQVFFTAPISTESVGPVVSIPIFSSPVQVGNWTVIMQLEPNSEASTRDLQVEVLANGVPYQEFRNTRTLDRPLGGGNDDRTSQCFCVVCDAGLVPPVAPVAPKSWWG